MKAFLASVNIADFSEARRLPLRQIRPYQARCRWRSGATGVPHEADGMHGRRSKASTMDNTMPPRDPDDDDDDDEDDDTDHDEEEEPAVIREPDE
jgi:hypothetical protein